MDNKHIIIVSTDEEYILNIEKELAFQLADNVIIEIISDLNYFEEYQKQPHKVDIILIDECNKKNVSINMQAEHIFDLVDNPFSFGSVQISKYGGAQAIIRCLPHGMIKNIDFSKQTIIVDVCSVSGGAGKTATALGTAYRLAEEGRKVLYMNMESFQTFYGLLSKELPLRAMSERLIMSMTMNPRTAADCTMEEVIHDKIDIIPQLDELTGNYQISLKTYYALVDELVKRHIYDYIFCEYPRDITIEMMTRILAGRRLLITTIGDRAHLDRLGKFSKLLKTYSGQAAVVCSRCADIEDDFMNGADFNLSIPVCEKIPEMKNFSLESLLTEGYFRCTAEAIS